MALCIIGRPDFIWSIRNVSVRSVPWAETTPQGQARPQHSLLRLEGHELLVEEWKEEIFKISLGK